MFHYNILNSLIIIFSSGKLCDEGRKLCLLNAAVPIDIKDFKNLVKCLLGHLELVVVCLEVGHKEAMNLLLRHFL